MSTFTVPYLQLILIGGWKYGGGVGAATVEVFLWDDMQPTPNFRYLFTASIAVYKFKSCSSCCYFCCSYSCCDVLQNLVLDVSKHLRQVFIYKGGRHFLQDRSMTWAMDMPYHIMVKGSNYTVSNCTVRNAYCSNILSDTTNSFLKLQSLFFKPQKTF